MSTDSYRQAAQRLAVVLQTQVRQRQPYAAAADEVELAVYTRLLQNQPLRPVPVADTWGARERAAEGMTSEL